MVETGWWRLDGGDWMVETGWWRLDGGDWMVVTGWYELDGLECLDKTNLCDRADCVADRWIKNRNQGGTAKTYDNMWRDDDGVEEELKNLSAALSSGGTNGDTLCNHINGSGKEVSEEEKTVCKFIAAGLESIYEIKAKVDSKGNITKKALEDQLFERTMRCVLLNAFADKLEALPCADENKIKDAIDKAFGKSSVIMGATSPCKSDGDKCFTCERKANFSCEINSEQVKTKLDHMLTSDADMKKTLKESAHKICGGQCKNISGLCSRAQCAGEQWFEDMGKSKTSKDDKDAMWEKVQEQVTSFDKALPDNGGNIDDADDLCKEVKCPNGNADCVSKTTCKIMVKALKDIHGMKENGSDTGPRKVNNRIFKSTMRCVALNAFAETLRLHAEKGGYACVVQEGIDKAFKEGEDKREEWCGKKGNGNGKEDGSCEKCQIGKCITSKIEGDPLWSKVVGMLDDITTNTKIQPTLSEIKRKVTLCDRVNCIANWYHKKKEHGKGEEKFWNEHVKTLWNELAGAMNTNSGTGNGDCNQVKDDTEERDATDPEKKACNYLHAGLKKLYTTTTSSSSTRNDNPVLDYPPFRRTVGCFLLHAYAKHMKSKANCLVESGIKKAFEVGGKCTNNSGSCIECKWDENLDNCNVTIEKNSVTVKAKVDPILKVDEQNMKTVIENINEMQNLCDYIKCAAPKWFHNHKNKNGNKGSPTHSWCDFWDTTVKEELKKMFQKIVSDGNDTSKTNANVVCNKFGDENPHSVERKACNHITAGLDYINQVLVTQNGNTDDDKFFKRSMMCAALNLYATKIKKESEDKCPIDEEKITQMFDDWNKQNNPNSSPSPSCKSGVYDCFVCKRDDKILDGCNLLVDKGLIGTASLQSGQNCNDNGNNRKEVQTQMNQLLDKESQMQQTLNKQKWTNTLNRNNVILGKGR
ncbi:SICAvar, type I (fragment) [Plasmodium knowlesi strain H]|uniref:SICAvar, type I n=1 Tax=Plasmodium knowlesi (strain H) TaxID=5851 RepID=A0A1A7VW62_PLAKH